MEYKKLATIETFLQKVCFLIILLLNTVNLLLTEKYTEPELLRLLKAGNDSAFIYLYERFGGGLYSTILQIIPHPQEAATLLKETFKIIQAEINNFDEEKGRLFTWMLGIARGLAITFLKTKGNGWAALHNGYKPCGLKHVLEKLPIAQRELIELTYFKGYSAELIAEKRQIPVAAAREQLNNALTQLKVYLK